jgi:hypothetical protein
MSKKSSDLVTLSREELGVILESQNIVPLSLQEKENYVYISMLREYTNASWNFLKLDTIFPILAYAVVAVLLSNIVFELGLNKIVVYAISLFYLLVFAVLPIIFARKKGVFKLSFQNIKKFFVNIFYFYVVRYIVIGGAVFGISYANIMKELFTLVLEFCKLLNQHSIHYIGISFEDKTLELSIILTTVSVFFIWIILVQEYLVLIHKKWRSKKVRDLLPLALPCFMSILLLVSYIAQYVLIDLDGAGKELSQNQLRLWLKINVSSIGLCIIMLYGTVMAYDFNISKKYELKYSSLFRKASFKNES